jgi:hypothetical protein
MTVGDPIIFNCRFRDTEGNAVVPFDDVGLNKDGTVGIDTDDYQAPSIYPTDRVNSNQAWVVIMPHVYLEQDPDLEPVGTYLGLKIFDWSPSLGTAIEHNNEEGATFDPVVDLVPAARFTYDPVNVYPWYKDGVIEVLYTFGTFAPQQGFVVADFGTLSLALQQTEYRTRGFEAYVGLNFASRGQLLRPREGGKNGPMLGKTRRVDQFAVHAHRTGFIQFADNFDAMDIKYLVNPGDPATDECGRRPLYSGVYHSTLRTSYSFDNMIAWEQPRPAPGTILSVGGFMTVSDR